MIDRCGRNIDYLRISVTDRCNLRCIYCMPEEGIRLTEREKILQEPEIIRVCKVMAELGITKIKITGGEPLVRSRIPELIYQIKEISGIEKVTLTTNGILLKGQMKALAESGLDSLNISLDTLDRECFCKITRRDLLDGTLDGIKEAMKYPEVQLKINCVPLGLEEQDLCGIAEFARKNPVHVRFIEMMPIGYGNMSESISNEELKETIRKHYGNLTEDFRVYGNGPAVYYSIEGFQGNVGFISAMHGKFCNLCNRIRMTSTGDLKPCLCYEQRWALKPALRMENPEKRQEEIQNILRKSIENKPQMHCFEDTRQVTESHPMGQIGG